MATYTENFNLEKPAQNEAVDVDVLNSNSDIIDDNLGQAKQLALNIGYGYNNAVPYFVGDYCVYQNKLYRCIQNILIPENFDETKWQQCTLGGELQNIKGNTDDNITDVLVKLKIGEKVYKICDFANDNLADTYSSSSTYDVGDYVIHNDVLYKCTTAVSTAEPFDNTKWTSCLITDEMGSGGGGGGHEILDDDGNTLTQRSQMQFVGTYSEDDSTNEITKVNIVREMTKAEFDLLSDNEKTGIINVTDEDGTASIINGVFIDTDNVIQAKTTYTSSGMSYTATEDCVVVIGLVNKAGDDANAYIDGELVQRIYCGRESVQYHTIFLKKGQTLTATTSYTETTGDLNYTVYGIQQGSQETTKSEIYSTDEKVVGTWIDGSPIYQITEVLNSVITINSSANASFQPSWFSSVDMFISCMLYRRDEDSQYGAACYQAFARKNTDTNKLNLYSAQEFRDCKIITFQYTKTSS